MKGEKIIGWWGKHCQEGKNWLKRRQMTSSSGERLFNLFFEPELCYLCLVSGTVLTRCRKFILFYTSRFPLIIGERTVRAFEGGETSSPSGEKLLSKKQTNKLCGRNTGGYQSFSSIQLSGRFLADSALTSKEGLGAILYRTVQQESGTYT